MTTEEPEESNEQIQEDPEVAASASAYLEEAIRSDIDSAGSPKESVVSVSKKLGAAKHAFIPMSKAYRFAALYLTPEQIKQAAMWKRPPGWPSFVPWCAPIVKACQMWLNPNIGAAMEIADRTEGKVKQTLEVENRGVVALPLIQISSAEEWRKVFAPGQDKRIDNDITITVTAPERQMLGDGEEPKTKRGRKPRISK